MNWQEVWANKKTDIQDYSLKNLLILNGYDTGYGDFHENDYIDFIKENIINRTNINDYICDIGCGSGSTLKILQDVNYKNLTGYDYSESLINIAKNHLDTKDLFCDEFINFKGQFDYCYSIGVFFYFHDKNYAMKALDKMLNSSNKGFYIFDLPDKSKKDACEKWRMGTMGEKAYKKKYEGLNHLYYSKDFFKEYARINNLNIEIRDQNIKNYQNSQWRFNVFFTK